MTRWCISAFRVPARLALFVMVSCSTVCGCDPYERQQGEFNAGPVDPAYFPLAYLGTGASPIGGPYGRQSGLGRFVEIKAYVDQQAVGYFSFPFTTAQLAAADPLRLLDNGKPYAPVPVAMAYVFDPLPPRPFPTATRCTTPPNYHYDRRTEDVRLDEQGNIFTRLPSATEVPGVASTFSYVPIVSEFPVSASGMPCQSIKSERTLLKKLGTPFASARYLLWPIIDPASGVYRFGENPSAPYGSSDYASGLGIQSLGWFQQYFLAYLDGGYLPTDDLMVTEQMITKPIVRMRTQRIYVPRSLVQPSMGTAAPGVLGAGYDVLQFQPGQAGYSPVCQVWSYSTGATAVPVAMLPQSEAAILGLAPQPVTTGTRFVYCPQVQ
jgi:hypothetical protein